MSDQVAKARYELYSRWMNDPVNPELNEWWDELNPESQTALSELHKRGKVFEQEQSNVIEDNQRKQSLVEEILNQEPIDNSSFKSTQKQYQGDGNSWDMGLVQYSPDNTKTVINDLDKLKIMLTPEMRPEDLGSAFSDMDEYGKWIDQVREKESLKKQGFRLYNIDRGYIVEPPKKEATVLDIGLGKYLGTFK
jgi:hypothetical protein